MGQTKAMTLPRCFHFHHDLAKFTFTIVAILTTSYSSMVLAQEGQASSKATNSQASTSTKSSAANSPLPTASPSPTMIPPDALQTIFVLPKKEQLNRFQKMNYELEGGGGVPGNQSLSGLSFHFAVSVHQFTNTWFDYSLYVRKSSSKGTDEVTFDTTYSEKRSYSIGVLQMGVGARIRFTPSQHLELRSGYSKTSSVLTKISSTAPTGPALNVGYEKAIPWGVPLSLLYSYEWRQAKIGAAATAALSLSALGKNESTSELTLGLSIRFYATPWKSF